MRYDRQLLRGYRARAMYPIESMSERVCVSLPRRIRIAGAIALVRLWCLNRCSCRGSSSSSSSCCCRCRRCSRSRGLGRARSRRLSDRCRWFGRVSNQQLVAIVDVLIVQNAMQVLQQLLIESNPPRMSRVCVSVCERWIESRELACLHRAYRIIVSEWLRRREIAVQVVEPAIDLG